MQQNEQLKKLGQQGEIAPTYSALIILGQQT